MADLDGSLRMEATKSDQVSTSKDNKKLFGTMPHTNTARKLLKSFMDNSCKFRQWCDASGRKEGHLCTDHSVHYSLQSGNSSSCLPKFQRPGSVLLATIGLGREDLQKCRASQLLVPVSAGISHANFNYPTPGAHVPPMLLAVNVQESAQYSLWQVASDSEQCSLKKPCHSLDSHLAVFSSTTCCSRWPTKDLTRHRNRCAPHFFFGGLDFV